MSGNNIHSQITVEAEIHVPKGFTEAANHTGMIKDINGQLQWVDLDSFADKSNLTAIVDPIVTNDSSQGYVAGSRWVNAVQNNIFFCVDAAVGSAIWVPVIRVQNDSTNPPTISNDASQGFKEGSIWIQTNAPLNVAWMCVDPVIGNAQWIALNEQIVTGIDHRTLSHLIAPADDHTQYVHIDGRRAMTGNLSLGENQLTNVAQINGVTIPDQNILRVKLNPGNAEYASIASAVAAITTASSTNPFVVSVAPGSYVEPQIQMKPYVYVVGTGFDATIITPADPTHHLILGADFSAIISCMLTGVTGSGQALVYHSTLTGTSQNPFWIEDCRFGASDTLVIAEGNNTGASSVTINSCRFGGTYSFNTGFYVRTTGSQPGKITCLDMTTSGMQTPYPADVFLVDGDQCELVLNSIQCRSGGTTTGNAVRARNGALLRILSIDIKGFGKGLWLENVGAGVAVTISSLVLENNTIDLQIDNTGTTGVIEANAAMSKSSIVPGAIGLSLILLDTVAGTIATSGTVDIEQSDGTFTDVSTLALKGGTMGYLSGGVITVTSGLTVSVSAGAGYLDTSGFVPGGSIYKVTWTNTPITLAANSINYLYFDQNATLNTSISIPNLAQYIFVGRVVTNASGVLFIDQEGQVAQHRDNLNSVMFRSAYGSIYESGSEVTASGLNLDVSSGIYFFDGLQFNPSGGAPITWSSFYGNGSGGWIEIDGVNAIDYSNYDDGSGTLQPIDSDQYAKHTIYVVGQGANEKYFMVYSQAEYTALTLAEQSNNPTPPPFFTDSVTIIAAVIVQQGVASITEIRDQRPRISFAPSGVAATTFHRNLLGLTVGDDHPQYWRDDGTHVATGDFNLGNNNITNVNQVNGVVVQAHAARHQPGGADAIPTDVASTITPDLSNAVGTSTSLARADHIHDIPTAVAVTISADTTNTQGSTTSFSRADHTHAITTAAPITQGPDNANAPGSAAGVARADHVHNIPSAIATGLGANTSNGIGTSTSFSRADHTHSVASGTVITQGPDNSNAPGTSSNFARADHVHNIPSAIAVSVTNANAVGTSTSFSRADHTHQGIHSISANGGTEEFGDIALTNGVGVTVTDTSGSFKIDTNRGPNELFVSISSGLNVVYTGGTVLVSGTFHALISGSLTLPATTSGYIVVNSSGVVQAAPLLPLGDVVLAQFTTNASSITALTDARTFIGEYLPFSSTDTGDTLVARDSSGNTVVNGLTAASATVTGTTTLNTSLNGFLTATAGVVSSGGSILPIANGGTGQSSFTAGALSTDGATITSGTLSVADGGTGQTSFAAGALSSNGAILTSGTLSVADGGTGTTTSTGTGSVVLSNSPSLTAPNLDTPSAVTLTNGTDLPLTTGVTGVLPIANGGTNANSVTNARANLGIDAGELFITTGTTYTTPSTITTATQFKFTLVGGGGGGAGAQAGNGDLGSGGGAGGAGAVWLTGLSPSTAYTVTIGAAGAAGAAAGAGGNGGNTTLIVGATTYTAAGGTGGPVGLNENGGAGGTTTNLTIAITGQAGDGIVGGTGLGVASNSGRGGSSGFGFGLGGASVQGANVGKAATGYGGGGGGGSSTGTSMAGGAGTAGCILVEYTN